MENNFIQKLLGLLLYIAILIFLLPSCETEEGILEPPDTETWIQYGTSQGLAGNTIRDIFEDRQGTLWFATGNGVTWYDGTSWGTYNTSNSLLGNNNVWAVIQDRDDDIWFGTSTGIYFLVDNSQWFIYEGESGGMNVNEFYRDRSDYIWTATEGDGVYVYDNTEFGHILFDAGVDEFNLVNDIAEDVQGRHWLATDFGAFFWENNTWNWQTTDEGLPEMEVTSLFFDSKFRLWFGTGGGEQLAYHDGNVFIPVDPFTGQDNIFVFDITEDMNGNIWFATFIDGVVRYDGAIMESFKPYNGYPAEDNFSVTTDSKGNTWFGTVSFGAIKYMPPVFP